MALDKINADILRSKNLKSNKDTIVNAQGLLNKDYQRQLDNILVNDVNNANNLNGNDTPQIFTTESVLGVNTTSAPVETQRVMMPKTAKKGDKEFVNIYNYQPKELLTQEQINDIDLENMSNVEKATGKAFKSLFDATEKEKAILTEMSKVAIGLDKGSKLTNVAASENEIRTQEYANEVANNMLQYPSNNTIHNEAESKLQNEYQKELTDFVTGATTTTLSLAKNRLKLNTLQAKTFLKGAEIVAQDRRFREQLQLSQDQFQLEKEKFQYQQDRDEELDEQWLAEFEQNQSQFDETMQQQKQQFEDKLDQSKSQFDKIYEQTDKWNEMFYNLQLQ